MYLKMVVGICFTQNHQKIQPRLTNPMLSIKGGVMDIQRKAFEESNNVNPDWSFKFDEELQQYVAVDFEMTNQVDEFNEHWDTFRAGWDAKAQAVPESNALLSAAMDAVQKLGSGDFVLVPKEPTKEMIRMGDLTFAYDECVDARKIYKAMIEAQEQSHENG